MPLPEGTKYRWRRLPSGKKQRLAFNPSGKVIEVKSGLHGKPRLLPRKKKS